MLTIGIEHGTTKIAFAVLKDSKLHNFFSLDRKLLAQKQVSVIDTLKRVLPQKLSEVKMIGISYSMGDALTEITPIQKVKNRGILSTGGTGEFIGGGTQVFDEISSSGLPAVVIPGIHRNLPCLDPRFRAAYSHHGGADKVGTAYEGYLYSQSILKKQVQNLIISDISSGTVTILIKDGKIHGAIDACLGAMGLYYGPLDLEMIRKIDNRELTANEAFTFSGARKVACIKEKEEIIQAAINGDPKAQLAFETLIMAVTMEIAGISSLVDKLDCIIITGSIGAMESPINIFEKIKQQTSKLGPVLKMDETSTAIGCAKIAQAVVEGAKEILGIKVTL
ncbi:MAG: methanogenesis marker 12 protein [Euryarchaeota archaeon]|nr:methanogenesis marker 12 protein [Euryarchaeota archaeon]